MIFENNFFVLNIDFETGKIKTLQEKATGRELLAKPTPVCEAVLHSGKSCPSCAVTPSDACYRVRFQGTEGTARLRITVKEDYIVFGIAEADIPGLNTLNFCVLEPAPSQYHGILLSMASDDRSGVCLCALNYETLTQQKDGRLFAHTNRLNGTFSGCEAALIAAAKTEIIPALQSLTKQEAVPKSPCGGAWALQSGKARGSYMFADVRAEDLEQWIRITKRGGFKVLHFHEWWTSWGHYVPKKSFFPEGFSQLQKCIDRVHAEGLYAGLHMLSGCVQPHDPWITPVPSPDLSARAVYSLAADIDEDSTVVTVRECPKDLHHLFMTYSGNGNVLRIDDELIQYEEISREEPYQFRKCQRGAFGTSVSKHRVGTEVDYLRQRYMAFYPKIKSPMFYQLIENVSAIYKSCHVDMIYMDGAEGIGERKESDCFRWELYNRLAPILMQTSDWSPNIWWFCSGLGAWDIPYYGPKQFIDMHLRVSSKVTKSDLLPCQMGWWVFLGATKEYRAQTIDVVDYYGTKNLFHDASMSLQFQEFRYVTRQNARILDMLTVIGWYERARLARYFTPESIAVTGIPGREFQMRLNDSGYWKFREVHACTKKLDTGKNVWKWNNPAGTQPLNLRLEALYHCAEKNGKLLTDFSGENVFLKGDVQKFTIQESIPGGPNGKQIRLVAENKTGSPRGAWVQLGQNYPVPYFNMDKSEAVSVWVKGDNSGALLNVQIHCPQEFLLLRSEHYITLNFSGWRHFELHFRERDAEKINDYVWPYDEMEGDHAIYGTVMNREHVDQISVFLNEIPAHGKVDVAFTPLMGFPAETATLRQPKLALNGERFVLPVDLKSDEYVELENGVLAHYDSLGRLAERIPFRPPMVKSGENQIETQFDSRAELRCYSLDKEFGELNPQYDRASMQEEFEMPMEIIHGQGAAALHVRTGQTAHLLVELEVQSADTPVSQIQLLVDGDAIPIPEITLTQGMRLQCNSDEWMTVDSSGTVTAKGKLSSPVPVLKTTLHTISAAFRCEGKHRVFLNLKKEYLNE